MNSREKMLAACVVSVLALCGLWVAVQWGVIDRWRNLNKNIAAAVQKEKDLRKSVASARQAEARWSALRPISHNPELGAQRFREDMTRLLERHGLGADCTIRKLPPRKLTATDDFTEVRLSITARGTLSQVFDFLYDFYRREYPTRLDQIGLTAEDQGRRTRTAARARPRAGAKAAAETPEAAAPADPDGPRLNVTITASALVLPEFKDGPNQPAIEKPEPDDPNSVGRNPRPRSEYAAVMDQNLFKIWQPEAKPVVAPPPVAQAEPNAQVVAPVQQPPRVDKKVVGVTSTLGRLTAYVRDEQHREQEVETLHLNDPVDDGTLVLVHPRGLVVRVATAAGQSPAFNYYLYKLGARYSEREVLDPQRYPEIQKELELFLSSR